MNTESMHDLMSNPTRSDRFGDYLTFGQSTRFRSHWRIAAMVNRALWICLWTVLKAESAAFQANRGMIKRWIPMAWLDKPELD